MHRFSRALVALVVLFTVVGCATSTAPGAVGITRPQLLMVPSSTINARAAASYMQLSSAARQEGKLNNDPVLTARARDVAARLIGQVGIYRAEAVGWDWEVNVIDHDEINANCAPGGKITIYSALFRELNPTDDELAAVVGHEIAHALREHTRERISQAQLSDAIVRGIASSGSRNADLKAKLANLGAELFVHLPYSREMELEADVMGLELMARAGYDLQMSLSFWRKMQARGSDRTAEFFRTHPSHDRRVAELEVAMPKVLALYEATAVRRTTGTGQSGVIPVAPSSLPSAPVSAVVPAPQVASIAAKALSGGQDSYQVERMAKRQACNADPRATLTAKGPGYETYAVPCSNGDTVMFRCEFGNCRALK